MVSDVTECLLTLYVVDLDSLLVSTAESKEIVQLSWLGNGSRYPLSFRLPFLCQRQQNFVDTGNPSSNNYSQRNAQSIGEQELQCVFEYTIVCFRRHQFPCGYQLYSYIKSENVESRGEVPRPTLVDQSDQQSKKGYNTKKVSVERGIFHQASRGAE